jgi:hypothetical protein
LLGNYSDASAGGMTRVLTQVSGPSEATARYTASRQSFAFGVVIGVTITVTEIVIAYAHFQSSMPERHARIGILESDANAPRASVLTRPMRDATQPRK